MSSASFPLDHYGFINWFNQPQLERLLRAKIEDDGGIEALYGHEALVLWEDEKNYITIKNNGHGDS